MKSSCSEISRYVRQKFFRFVKSVKMQDMESDGTDNKCAVLIESPNDEGVLTLFLIPFETLRAGDSDL